MTPGGDDKDGFKAWKQLYLLATAGLQVVVSVLIGFGMGLALDRWLGTAPWLMLLFIIFGVAAGAAVTLSFYLRLGLMAAALTACLKAGWIHVPALMLGLSLTFAAVALWLLASGRARGAALEMDART